MQALLVCEPLAALKVWILVRWVEGPLPHWLLFFSPLMAQELMESDEPALQLESTVSQP